VNRHFTKLLIKTIKHERIQIPTPKDFLDKKFSFLNQKFQNKNLRFLYQKNSKLEDPQNKHKPPENIQADMQTMFSLPLETSSATIPMKQDRYKINSIDPDSQKNIWEILSKKYLAWWYEILRQKK
jgi:hypothetical protein